MLKENEVGEEKEGEPVEGGRRESRRECCYSSCGIVTRHSWSLQVIRSK